MQISSAGQKPPIRTPRDAIEDGVDVVGVLKERHPGSCARVPQPDDVFPRATGQPAPIGAPADLIDDCVMATQQPGRRSSTHYRTISLPDGDQSICTATDQPRAIRTPVDVEEGGRIALDDAFAL